MDFSMITMLPKICRMENLTLKCDTVEVVTFAITSIDIWEWKPSSYMICCYRMSTCSYRML